MTTYTSIGIIYNPNSTGNGAELAENLKRNLLKLAPDTDVTLFETEYAGHAEKLAYQEAMRSGVSLVISSSGDGGYHEVINGIMKAKKKGAQVVAGLLPAGNANDHFHEVHRGQVHDRIIRNDIDRANLLKIKIVRNFRKKIVYGHSYAGLGITPSVGAEFNKIDLNPFNEIWTFFRTLFSFDAVKIKRGRVVDLYDSIVVSTISKMSKYMVLTKDRDLLDKGFLVNEIKKQNKFKLFLLLLRISTLGLNGHRIESQYKFRLLSDSPMQIDGEVLYLKARSKVTVTLKRDAVPYII